MTYLLLLLSNNNFRGIKTLNVNLMHFHIYLTILKVEVHDVYIILQYLLSFL